MTPDDEFLFEDAATPPTKKGGRQKKVPPQSAVPEGARLSETGGGSAGHEERPFAGQKTTIVLEDPHVVILASAGTGKTFQLTNRYLTLLRSGTPDRILASTFTRKAAGEILDRILVRLADAVTSEDALRIMQKFVGHPPLTREECIALLRQVTRQLHRVQISTLDALFSKLASSHAFELGFPPGWRMMEDVEAGRLIDQAIEAVLRQAGRQDARRLMHLLSKGENSRRVHDLIRETVNTFSPPYQLTQEAHWNCIPDLPVLNELELSGAIAFLESVRIDDKRISNAIEKSRGFIRADDWESFLSQGLGLRIVVGDTTYYNKELPGDIVAAYEPLVQHAKALFYKIWSSQTRGTWETLHRVHTELDRLKNEERLLDFGDVSRRLADRMTDRSVNDVHFRLDVNLDHLLLDEFQDTSLIQWQILRPFAEATTGSDDGDSSAIKSFFCVGDRKQAIYGWRGGEAAIFDTIQAEFPILKSRQLDVSRRSSPPVIEAVNRAFLSLRGTTAFESLSPAISDWCESFPPHDTARKDLHGYVQMEVVDPPATPGAGQDDGSEHATDMGDALPDGMSTAAKPKKPVKFSKADLADQVLERTADRMAEYSRMVPSATMAALFRGNAPIRLLANKLRARGVEFSEEGGTLLTDSAAVQLLLSLLKIADHPGDRVARFHVATSPLAEIHQFHRWDDDEAAVRLSGHLRTRLLNDGYLATIQRWAWQLREVATPHDQSRLRQLVELAEGYRATLRPRDFILLVETRKVGNTTPARIQLMTIHQSKGLQFDIVFLPDLDQTLVQPPKYLTAKSQPAAPPDRVLVYRSKSLKDILPEELQVAYDQTQTTEMTGSMCVLYVAMTRAVHALHLILPPREAKTVPKTQAGLLLEGLGGGASSTAGTLYETGDSRWCDQCPALQRPAPLKVTRTAARSITFAPLTGGRRRGMERVVPSQVAERATKVRLRSAVYLGDSAGVDRGTLFHTWLEQIAWLDERSPSGDDLRQLAASRGAAAAEIAPWIRQFRALLKRDEIERILSRTGYQSTDTLPFSSAVQTDLASGSCELDLHQERRFSVVDSGQLISGSIDRLVLIRRNGQVVAADILDFKTDAMEADDESALAELAATYRDQMRSYAKAIGLIYRLPPERIATRLVVLSVGKLLSIHRE